MAILTEHKKKTLHSLSKKEEVQFITYNLKTKKFTEFEDIEKIDDRLFNKKNNYQLNNEVLIYIKEMFSENADTPFKIIESIELSSFSVSNIVKDALINYVSKERLYNFIKKEQETIQFIQTKMNSKTPTQAKKYYNNILLRLKFTRIDLLEKTLEEKEKNFKKAIERRDKIRKEKPMNDLIQSINKNNDLLF